MGINRTAEVTVGICRISSTGFAGLGVTRGDHPNPMEIGSLRLRLVIVGSSVLEWKIQCVLGEYTSVTQSPSPTLYSLHHNTLHLTLSFGTGGLN
jgi:hypothetical protein